MAGTDQAESKIPQVQNNSETRYLSKQHCIVFDYSHTIEEYVAHSFIILKLHYVKLRPDLDKPLPLALRPATSSWPRASPSPTCSPTHTMNYLYCQLYLTYFQIKVPLSSVSPNVGTICSALCPRKKSEDQRNYFVVSFSINQSETEPKIIQKTKNIEIWL